MNRTIGALGGFFLAAGIGSIFAPDAVTMNAVAVMLSAAALGFVLGAIADALSA